MAGNRQKIHGIVQIETVLVRQQQRILKYFLVRAVSRVWKRRSCAPNKPVCTPFAESVNLNLKLLHNQPQRRRNPSAALRLQTIGSYTDIKLDTVTRRPWPQSNGPALDRVQNRESRSRRVSKSAGPDFKFHVTVSALQGSRDPMVHDGT